MGVTDCHRPLEYSRMQPRCGLEGILNKGAGIGLTRQQMRLSFRRLPLCPLLSFDCRVGIRPLPTIVSFAVLSESLRHPQVETKLVVCGRRLSHSLPFKSSQNCFGSGRAESKTHLTLPDLPQARA